MTIQEQFEEVKDHPLVVLLLRRFAKHDSFPIPEIWQDFIRKSTESTCMDLMYSQLRGWKISPDQVPPDLRGQKLLDHLTGLKLSPILDRISERMRATGIGFIPAMEQTFANLNIIPSTNRANPQPGFALKTRLGYTYTERGTLTYEAIRSVPAMVHIPEQFIKENFGPRIPDEQIIRRFHLGMQTRFSTSTEPPVAAKLIPEYHDAGISGITGNVRMRTQTFPAAIRVSFSDIEAPVNVRLSNPVQNPTGFDSVSFTLPKDNCGSAIEAVTVSPACPLPTGEEPQTVFNAPLNQVIENPDRSSETRNRFIAALRNAYTLVTADDEFLTERKKAVETAAGL